MPTAMRRATCYMYVRCSLTCIVVVLLLSFLFELFAVYWIGIRAQEWKHTLVCMHENSVGLTFTTNPKPKGLPFHCLLRQA